MAEIPEIFRPRVNAEAARRNPEHWPASVARMQQMGYGGEGARKDYERRTGDTTIDPRRASMAVLVWEQEVDKFVVDYWLLPAGSFRDSDLDKSAKALPRKGQA